MEVARSPPGISSVTMQSLPWSTNASWYCTRFGWYSDARSLRDDGEHADEGGSRKHHEG